MEVQRRWPEVTTMIVSGASDVEQMRRVTTAGVFAYLVKPFDPAVLIFEVDKALEVARLRRENRRHDERLRGELAWPVSCSVRSCGPICHLTRAFRSQLLTCRSRSSSAEETSTPSSTYPRTAGSSSSATWEATASAPHWSPRS